MKYNFAHAFKICILIFRIFIYQNIAAQSVGFFEPVNQAGIPRITLGSIDVDGIIDWGYSYVNTLDFVYGCDSISKTDLSAQFQLAYDDEYLYLYVSVIDDSANCITKEYWDSSGKFDFIDLYLDPKTCEDPDSGAYYDDAVHLRWYRGSDSAFFPSSNWYKKADWLNVESFEIEYVIIEDTINNNGYTLETAIPWEGLLEKGKTHFDIGYYYGTDLGIEVAVGDSDNELDIFKNDTCMLFWDDDEGRIQNAWFDTRTFGEAILWYEGNIYEIGSSGKFPEMFEYYLTGNEVKFTNEISVFTIDGKFIETGKDFTLEKGIYIARRGKDAVKFMVW